MTEKRTGKNPDPAKRYYIIEVQDSFGNWMIDSAHTDPKLAGFALYCVLDDNVYKDAHCVLTQMPTILRKDSAILCFPKELKPDE